MFVVGLLYLPLVAVVKLSFLLFFQRIFHPNQKMKYCVRFGMFALGVFYIAMFFRLLFLCDPMRKSFNPILPGYCLEEDTITFSTGIFNTISDFYILLLPLPFIWGLKLEAGRKLRLMAVCSVGLL